MTGNGGVFYDCFAGKHGDYTACQSRLIDDRPDSDLFDLNRFTDFSRCVIYDFYLEYFRIIFRHFGGKGGDLVKRV